MSLIRLNRLLQQLFKNPQRCLNGEKMANFSMKNISSSSVALSRKIDKKTKSEKPKPADHVPMDDLQSPFNGITTYSSNYSQFKKSPGLKQIVNLMIL